jgi:IKI3 family
MDWSVDSEMLALVVAQSPAAGSNSPKADRPPSQQWVQVWRRSNWHWYLKHEARHDPAEVRVARFWSATVCGANPMQEFSPEHSAKVATVCCT